MRRGPKATPTNLLLLQGGSRKGGVNQDEPEPLPIEPPMPDWLEPYAQEEWRWIVPQMRAMGVLGLCDKAAIAAYCVAWGLWRMAQEKLTKLRRADDPTGGLLVRTSNGNPIHNPLLSVATAARRDVVRAAAELGLTPAARAQLTSGMGGNGDDEISRRYGI